MTLEGIIEIFENEFSSVIDKFIIIRVLDGKRELNYEQIENLKLPSEDDNLIWHPGVYVFYGHGKPYRVGRHLANSRYRVLEHLKQGTGNGTSTVWDINSASDAEILLLNVINRDDYHWVAAVEIYLEKVLKDQLVIPAKRQG